MHLAKPGQGPASPGKTCTGAGGRAGWGKYIARSESQACMHTTSWAPLAHQDEAVFVGEGSAMGMGRVKFTSMEFTRDS